MTDPDQSAPPILRPTPREEVCVARTRWDAESSLLCCDFDYPGARRPATTLRDHIDDGLGLGAELRRIVLGELDLVIQAPHRASSLELYTNPDRWCRRQATALPPDRPPIMADFAVTYDVNGIASFELPLEFLRDDTGRQLTLRLITAPAPELRWFELADTVAAGLDPRDRLVELRLTGVALP
jgi:hypothetical protein